MIINIKNEITLSDVPYRFGDVLKKKLTFQNPAYIEARKRNRYCGNIPQVLCFCKKTDDGFELPRGYIRKLMHFAKGEGVECRIEDRRRELPSVHFDFKGTLRPFQIPAVEDVLKHDFGVLSSATGSGKTCMGLNIISQRAQPCLVVVHSKTLLYQWRERAVQFLDIEESEVGLIGDQKRIIGPRLTIGIVNSVYRIANDIKRHFGHLIIDECHKIPSRSFTEAARSFDCKFMLGLSATAYRRDGLSRLIFWHLGDITHEVEKDKLVDAGHILKPKIIVRETNFWTDTDASEEYQTVLGELTEDRSRNALITADIAREARKGNGISLALSDRKSHCQTLVDMLKDRGVEAELLTGDIKNGERERIVKDLDNGRVKTVVATIFLLSEGFDLPALSNLFLCTPIKYRGRLIQAIGRILRPLKGKGQPKIYDYVDVNVGVLEHSFKSRKQVYDGR